MSLLDFRTAIVDGLKAAFPAITSIEAHAGRFDLAELKRFATAAPALRVAFLALPKIEEESIGGYVTTVRVGVFVLTKSVAGSNRAEGALAIVNTLVQKIPGNNWGMDGTVGNPSGIRGDNLYAAAVDKMNIALWAMIWEQTITLGEVDVLTLDDFATFDATYDVGETDTPATSDRITGLNQ